MLMTEKMRFELEILQEFLENEDFTNEEKIKISIENLKVMLRK